MNAFVSYNLTEDEYRIYQFLETSPNMSMEYVQCKYLMTPFYRKVHFKQVLVHIIAGTRGVSAACWTGYIYKDIFQKDFTKYEYRIYSYLDCKLANWPNTNIEYINDQKIEYSYLNI